MNNSSYKKEKMKIMNFLKKRQFALLGIVVGMIGGYMYYYFIGCNSGACPITSNPTVSIIYGGVLGYLFFDMFKSKKKKSDEIS